MFNINLIPLPYKILGAFVAVAALTGAGYFYGQKHANAACEVERLKRDAANAEAIAALGSKNEEIRERVVTEYVDRTRTIREKEYIYVTAANSEVPSQYILSNGWVTLHNVAAAPVYVSPVPGTVGDATPSGVTDNAALGTVVSNYSICKQNAEQLVALQRWVTEIRVAADQAAERIAE